jgi:gamma-glutamyltranspeptidase / glutathione hydrolase
MSGDTGVIRDRRLDGAALGALAQAYPTATARRIYFPYAFAVTAGVLRDRDLNMDCTEIMSPYGDAVAAD